MELQSIADDLGQAAVSGNLSQSIGFNVSSVGITAPPPPASDPTWNQVLLLLLLLLLFLVLIQEQ